MRSPLRGALIRAPLFFLLDFLRVAAADPYFDTLRYSPSTPSHCQEFSLSFFQQPMLWVTYGTSGATEQGFTHECPVARREAALLWRFLKEHRYRGPTGYKDLDVPKMQNLLASLEQAREEFGFSYQVEGELLEALALMDLKRFYDPDEFFFTGGIAYSRGSGSYLGELDIIVARKRDCMVVVVGESKLGWQRLAKAKEQLQRFSNFLQNQVRYP